MTILKIEIDTKDLRIDEEGYGDTFEDLFHSSLKAQIAKRVVENITSSEVNQYSMLVRENVESGVADLLKNLLNEDVVISDGYGRKKFIGSAEDYLKKEIDDKYLHPVNGSGERLEGCTTSSQSWIQWHLEKEIKGYIDRAISNAKDQIDRKISGHVNTTLENYTNEKIKERVSKKLMDIGLNLE